MLSEISQLRDSKATAAQKEHSFQKVIAWELCAQKDFKLDLVSYIKPKKVQSLALRIEHFFALKVAEQPIHWKEFPTG